MTRFGWDQTMQIYGNFEGFSPFFCIVWVGNIMTPFKWAQSCHSQKHLPKTKAKMILDMCDRVDQLPIVGPCGRGWVYKPDPWGVYIYIYTHYKDSRHYRWDGVYPQYGFDRPWLVYRSISLYCFPGFVGLIRGEKLTGEKTRFVAQTSQENNCWLDNLRLHSSHQS